MSTKERTNEQIPLHFINPSGLSDRLDVQSYRKEREIICDSKLEVCPKCNSQVKRTRDYTRTIDHLSERVYYRVFYYYCYSCHSGWPSLSSCILPNITVGLDVLGHVAYWHTFKNQSFKFLREHLQECHGIIRHETTLEKYVSRFSILIQDSLRLFDELIQAYLAGQTTRNGLFDESFFASAYSQKLCMGVLLLPEVKVIAGIKVSDKRNYEFIKQTMKDFQQRIGELDILTVDLSFIYEKPMTEVFTAISLQFCVFHFFQLINRKIVFPAAIELRKELREEIKSFRSIIKKQFRRFRKNLPGNYQPLLKQLESRILWCLRRRWPNHLVQELHELRLRLKKRIHIPINLSHVNEDQFTVTQILCNGLLELIELIQSFERKICQLSRLQAFQSLYEYMQEVKQLFQETDSTIFENQYQNLLQISLTSDDSDLKAVGDYLQKYRANLSIYLQTGVEKATSLLEHYFRGLKKSTSHNRGGHLKATLQEFGDLYQFFNNTTPFQCRGEPAHFIRSPLERMAEKIQLPLPVDLSLSWWEWLLPLGYQDYRNRVKHQKQNRVKEFRSLKAKKSLIDYSSSSSFKEKAKKRWRESQTLRQVSEIIEAPLQSIKTQSQQSDPPAPLALIDRKIYGILQENPEGLSRPMLVSWLNLPRTTIHDALVRLENARKIFSFKVPQQQRGRPTVKFKILSTELDPDSDFSLNKS